MDDEILFLDAPELAAIVQARISIPCANPLPEIAAGPWRITGYAVLHGDLCARVEPVGPPIVDFLRGQGVTFRRRRSHPLAPMW